MNKSEVLSELTAKGVSKEVFSCINQIDDCHFEGRFNTDHEFAKVRKYYPIGRSIFKVLSPAIKRYFKSEDLLVTDDNINPDYWNDQIIIMRKSFSTAWDSWVQYLYSPQHHGDFPKFRKGLYDSLAQKSIRLTLDLIQTMMMEDTIYRELFTLYLFELQYQLNKHFNPEIQQYHVLYTNYLSNDLRYLELATMVGKSRRMGPQFQTKVNNAFQAINEKYRTKTKEESGIR